MVVGEPKLPNFINLAKEVSHLVVTVLVLLVLVVQSVLEDLVGLADPEVLLVQLGRWVLLDLGLLVCLVVL